MQHPGLSGLDRRDLSHSCPFAIPLLLQLEGRNRASGAGKHSRLIRTIEELQPILRTVFVLQDIEGLSTVQAAEVLNLSQSAVKSRLWRARLQLRERLTKYFGKSAESTQVESTFYKRLARETPHSHRLVADQLNAT